MWCPNNQTGRVFPTTYWRLYSCVYDILPILFASELYAGSDTQLRHKSLCPLLLLDSGRYGAFYDLFDFSKNKNQVTQLYPTDQYSVREALSGCFTNSCNGWLVIKNGPLSPFLADSHNKPLHQSTYSASTRVHL